MHFFAQFDTKILNLPIQKPKFMFQIYEDAIKCYDQAISLNPTLADAYYNKGLTLYKINRNQEAIKYYDQAISLNPKYTGAYKNKGDALMKLGKSDEALVCFKKADCLKKLIKLSQSILYAPIL